MKIFAISVTVALNLIVVKCGYSVEKIISDNEIRGRKLQKLSSPEECAVRECTEGEPPLACHYHFTVEYYSTMSQACALCLVNTTSTAAAAGVTPHCQCVTTDGYEISGIITANRQLPGPSIMICKNDYVVIDVANHVTGNAITLHWHGLFLKGHQYYDGVPFVTQCPIPEGTTFRYQWIAQNAGTHFWHAHTGLHKAEGLGGPLIVREPKSLQPNHHLWDHDRLEHFIFIDDWFHSAAAEHFPGTVVRSPGQRPDNFLINGKGQYTDSARSSSTTTPLAVFTVKGGQRYRFRLINSCSLTCPVQMTIERHNLTIISTDGQYLEPTDVTSISSFSAERYDFVVHTNQTIGNYWIQFRGTGECEKEKIQQVAILHYEMAPAVEETSQFHRPTYEDGLAAGIVLNPVNIRCNGAPNATNAVCVNKLKSAGPVNPRVLEEPDLRVFLPISFFNYSIERVFQVGTYNRFIVTGSPEAGRMGNISNVLPSSPLISQRRDIPESQFCSIDTAHRVCGDDDGVDRLCQCLHVQDIPLNALVEFILVDENHFAGLSHPFHMHGHAYHVMAEAHAHDFGFQAMTLDIAKNLDKSGSIKRNFDNPPMKDTYAVPNNGLSVIRFIADNPGYWMFHCHFMFHVEVGMSLVLHVGEEKDLPPIPEGFPKCGNYLPTVYEDDTWSSRR